jgi:serine/threonine protein kinase/WD40 repeat protein
MAKDFVTLASGDWDALQAAVERFETAWDTGTPPRIEDFLTADPARRVPLLVELIHVDLERRLTRGEAARVEAYLERFPELSGDRDFVLGLIEREYEQRARRNDRIGPEEYVGRFPQYQAELQARLRIVPAQGATPTGRSPAPAPRPVIDSVASLVATLQESVLLRGAQRRELARLKDRFTEPRTLARELLQRSWLTAFQVNQLFLGRLNELVLGPYVLLERLGEGGMGTVFKARHQLMDRIVALKVIRKDRLEDEEAVRRFHREIRAAAQLSHPNVVTAYDAAQVGDTHFLVMEFVEGTDLKKLLGKRGPLPPAEACDYIRQAALGLQHAHERGLVHRDLKPANLLLTGTGSTVKILDLGLARLHRGEDLNLTAGDLTREGTVMGTPDYMAPEQALESRTADIRADLYSLGCTLFQLLTGQVPFAGGTLAQKIVRHQGEPPPALEDRRPDAPRGLGAVVRKLLAKRPAERYQTPAELALALETFCPLQSPRAIPLGAPGPLPPGKPVPVATLVGPAALDATLRIPGAIPLGGAVAPGPPREPAVGTGDETPTPGEAESLTVPPGGLRSPSRPVRRWRWLVPAGAAGMALIAVAAFILWPPGHPPPKPHEEDFLWNKIAPEDRIPGLPEDKVRLVGLLGENRVRMDAIKALALSRNGKLLAVGGTKGELKLADARTLHLRGVLGGHRGAVLCLAFSPNGLLLASSGADGLIRLWDLETGAERRPLKGHEKPVPGVAFVSEGRALLSAGQDGSVRLWDVKTGNHERCKVAIGSGGVLALSRDGTRAIISTVFEKKYDLIVWDIKEGRVAGRYRGHQAPVQSIAFCPTRNLVLSGCHYLHWWDPSTSTCKRVRDPSLFCGGPHDILHNVAFSPDGLYAITAGRSDGRFVVWVWDETGARRETVNIVGGGYGPALFLPDNRALVFASVMNLRTGDIFSNKELHVPVGHTRPVRHLSWSQNGKRLLSSGDDNRLCLWDMGSGRDLKRFRPACLPSPVRLSPGGRFALNFGPDKDVLPQVWEVASGKNLRELPDSITAAAFINETLVVTWGREVVRNNPQGPTAWGNKVILRRIDVTTGKGKKLLQLPQGNAAFLSPDGRRLLVLPVNANPFLWDVTTKKETHRWPHPFSPNVVIFPADGRRIYFGHADGTVGYYNLTTATPEKEAYPHWQKAPVVSLALTPDGRYLASTDARGETYLWDTKKGDKWCQWQNPGLVHDTAFAPDGRHLAAAADNGTICIFRLVGRESR